MKLLPATLLRESAVPSVSTPSRMAALGLMIPTSVVLFPANSSMLALQHPYCLDQVHRRPLRHPQTSLNRAQNQSIGEQSGALRLVLVVLSLPPPLPLFSLQSPQEPTHYFCCQRDSCLDWHGQDFPLLVINYPAIYQAKMVILPVKQ